MDRACDGEDGAGMTSWELAGIVPAAVAVLLLESAAICAVAACGRFALRRARPALAAAWMQSCLVALALLPLFRVWLPRWSFRMQPSSSLSTAGAGFWPSAASGMVEFLVAATVVYAAGVLLLFVRLIFGIHLVRRWRSGLSPVRNGQAVGVLTSTCARMGVRRLPALLTGDSATVPTAVGWLKPAVVVPGSLLSPHKRDLLESAVAHELAHIRRGDLWWALLDRVLTALYWPNTLVRWLSRQAAHLRELACDDWSASLEPDPSVYAERLGRIALLASPGSVPSAVEVQGQTVRDRTVRLGSLGNRPSLPKRAVRIALSVLALIACVYFAAVRTQRLLASSEPSQPPVASAAVFDSKNATTALQGVVTPSPTLKSAEVCEYGALRAVPR